MCYERKFDFPINLAAAKLALLETASETMIYAALILGCLLLYKGGDWLLDGMLGIGQKFGLPKAIVGLVLVSLGTSAPELFVSVGSTLQGHGGMAAGNVVGSNIINISIVLGMIVCLVVLGIERVLRHQLITVTVLSIFAVWVMLDEQVTRFEGLGLIIFMIASFFIAIMSGSKNTSVGENTKTALSQNSGRSILLTIGGILTLLLGAESLIWGGLGLAEKLDLSETVVALTVTALGTSLPEIAASVVAVARRETSLALGNVIGSNLLNIGLVLGLSALILPLRQVDLTTSTQVYFVGLVVLILVFSVKPGYLPKWLGYVLLLSYLVYLGIIIQA